MDLEHVDFRFCGSWTRGGGPTWTRWRLPYHSSVHFQRVFWGLQRPHVTVWGPCRPKNGHFIKKKLLLVSQGNQTWCFYALEGILRPTCSLQSSENTLFGWGWLWIHNFIIHSGSYFSKDSIPTDFGFQKWNPCWRANCRSIMSYPSTLPWGVWLHTRPVCAPSSPDDERGSPQKARHANGSSPPSGNQEKLAFAQQVQRYIPPLSPWRRDACNWQCTSFRESPAERKLHSWHKGSLLGRLPGEGHTHKATSAPSFRESLEMTVFTLLAMQRQSLP